MVTCTTPPFRAAVRLNSGVSARMNLVVDPKDELRWTAIVLAVFWGLAGLLFLLTWRIAACFTLTLGLAAAFERVLRVATQGSSKTVRLMAMVIGALLIGVFFGLLLLFNPAFG